MSSTTKPSPPQYVDPLGTPLPPGTRLLAPPPRQIGPITCVAPDMHYSRKRQIATFIAIIAFFGLIGLACLSDAMRKHGGGEFVGALFLLAIAGLFVWMLTVVLRPQPRLGYVGRNGIALFTPDASGAQVAKSTVLTFSDASALYVGAVHIHSHGIYVGTSYRYRWMGPEQIKLTGSYKKRRGLPDANHPYHFLLAAEKAWTQHVLQRKQAELKATRSISFAVNKQDCIRVGSGVMQMEFGGRREDISKADLQIRLRQGWFNLRGKGARKYRFRYARIADAQAFTVALSQLMGVAKL